MLVEQLMPAALARLVTIRDDAPLIEAAKLLRAGTDLVLVCSPEGLLAGVITKTDVVEQISHCLGASCTTAASLVMTSSLLKNLEMESFLILAGHCWDSAVGLDVIF